MQKGKKNRELCIWITPLIGAFRGKFQLQISNKLVKICLDSFNISVLNRIDADGSDWTVISEYTKYSKYTKSGLNWSWGQFGHGCDPNLDLLD